MNLPADPDGEGTDPDHRAPGIGGSATFTPLVLTGSLGWVRIAAPQAATRAACLAAAAYIHLMRPDVPLKHPRRPGGGGDRRAGRRGRQRYRHRRAPPRRPGLPAPPVPPGRETAALEPKRGHRGWLFTGRSFLVCGYVKINLSCRASSSCRE
jgi:hypothetical protein